MLDDKLTIACGEGAVRLLKVQRAGKQPMSAEEFLRGTRDRARQQVLALSRDKVDPHRAALSADHRI